MWTAGILKRPKVSGAQVNITNSFGFSSFYNLVNYLIAVAVGYTYYTILLLQSLLPLCCNCMYVLVFPACCYPPSSYCPYHGQCFHKHEPRKGCGVIYTCRQGSQGAEACYRSGSRFYLPRSGDFPSLSNICFSFFFCYRSS